MRPSRLLFTSVALLALARDAAAQRPAVPAPRTSFSFGLSKGAGALTVVGRPMDMCYTTESNGDQARGGACAESTGSGAVAGITWDDPRSPFNGVRRRVDINGNRISNGDGPSVWYTDPYGRRGRTEAFPGSIRQVISRINTAIDPHGPTIGSERNYGGLGVRAPN